MPADRASDNPVVRQLQLLTTGWGYNFYNDANRARADDLLVREKAAHFLGEAVAALSGLESGYRQQFIPPATRDHPFPPSESMEHLRAMGRLKAHVSAVSDRLRGASAPTQDKIWFRIRGEQNLLQQLLAADHGLIADATVVAEAARDLTADAWNASAEQSARPLEDALKSLDQALRQRQEMLLVPSF